MRRSFGRVKRWLLVLLVAAWIAPDAHAAGAQRILYASDWTGATEIFAVDPSGRAPLAPVTCAQPPPCHCAAACAFSPDGKTLAFVGAGGLTLLRSGHEHLLARGALGPFAWSPDGSRIAYSSRAGISLVELASGKSRVAYPVKRWQQRFQLPLLELA